MCFGAGILVLVGLFGIAWAMTPIPDSTQKEATAQGSVIYYRDGKTVLARKGIDRKIVPLAKVPEHVREAVIAAENRSFYEDAGVSIKGTTRALWSTVTGQQLQGGSTITQQLVRNYYSGLSQERSITRKFKEILISMKVDQSKSKDWVLEQYLNTIYFGRGANGIQSAAQAYFGKDVQDLTVAEGAYLASVIQQPSRFADPQGPDLEAVMARWQSVIKAMGETGALTPQQVATERFPALKPPKKPFEIKGQGQYMLEQVTAELNRRGYTDEDINSGGLKVVTTFDKKLMDAAQRAVKQVLPDATPKKVRTGLAAVDPGTGEVVAFYGGRPSQSAYYDSAFSAKVMAGSTFKPYTLAAALDNGFDLSTRVDGNSPLHVASADKPIPNDSNRSYGQIDLVQATQNSVNTAFVDLGQKVGLDKVASVVEAAGIPKEQVEPHAHAASFPLGVASVSAVQNASGFSTFANKGVHVEAHVVKSVTDGQGRKDVVKPVSKRVVGEQAAADTIYAMQQVVKYGTGTAARLYDRPVAGKTGTTDDSKAVWFNGFTPQLAVAVDMFRDDNETVTIPGYGTQFGGQLPAQVWRAFMTEAMAGKPVEEFPEPSDYGYDYGYDYSAPQNDPSAPPQDGFDRPPNPQDWGTPPSQPAEPPVTEPPATQAPETGQPVNPDNGGDGGTGGNGGNGGDGGRATEPPAQQPTSGPDTGAGSTSRPSGVG
ncbi:transglycosylase domain-containing protein [Nonomuraea pusilla]|uniref:Membrane carboxypeptidase (Penicillin-binding protein) n=1 Tax=Nonomuraea pusilla TaxID=46177 RepID=A0A1H7GM59_9ACTN|nr:transglycosylase domain-containing protein [Nonomuraea pusilla]SEK39233.1 Membrane carboxypeptidase (penicillin-binding protein) [Nonomuraea pusilla]